MNSDEWVTIGTPDGDKLLACVLEDSFSTDGDALVMLEDGSLALIWLVRINGKVSSEHSWIRVNNMGVAC